MWRFLDNASRPPQKNKKTDEERLENQREYDHQKRERKFQPKWKNEFVWLDFNQEKNAMTCRICKQFDTSGTFITGCDNFKVQTIKRHDISDSHQSNTRRCNAKNQQPGTSKGEKTLNLLHKSTYDKLNLLFRNSHYIAKLGKPYTDYVSLCELDRAKGLDIGQTYITDKYCSKFVTAIADTRRLEQDQVIQASKFISVISDGATDTASKEAEIVLVRSSYECKVSILYNKIPYLLLL